MHMISRKDLNDAEMDTLTISCSPTTVITANGEVQTHEEATVYVKELDILLTMKLLENTPEQYCRSESFAMKTDIPMNGSMVKKPHLIKNGIRLQCDTENFVPIVVPGLSTGSSSSSPSTSKTPSRQERPCSTFSSSSSSSPTTSSSDNETREREDRTESDTSPVLVSTNVDYQTGQPVVDQANQKKNFQKQIKKETKIERGNPLWTKPTKNFQKQIKEETKIERSSPLSAD